MPQKDRRQANEHPQVQNMGTIVNSKEATHQTEGLLKNGGDGQIAETPAQRNLHKIGREHNPKPSQRLLLIQVKGREAAANSRIIASCKQRPHGL